MNKIIAYKKIQIMLYIICTLGIDWILAFAVIKRGGDTRNILLLIMFIPGITALIFQRIYNVSIKQHFLQSALNTNLKSTAFAIIYPLSFIAVCAAISAVAGLGRFNAEKALNLNRFINFLINSVLTILPAAGEELGWRGYLLPDLTRIHGKVKSMVILGVVWVSYHIPVIYVLSGMDGAGNPVISTIIQACSLFVLSFSFSYCYYISGSVIAASLIHAVWNSANTWILGDIFSRKTAMIEGNIFFINGEGLIGLVIGAITMIAFIYKLKIENRAGSDALKLRDCGKSSEAN